MLRGEWWQERTRSEVTQGGCVSQPQDGDTHVVQMADPECLIAEQ